MDWTARLDSKSRGSLMAFNLALVFLIGVGDYLTGYEITFSVFYFGNATELVREAVRWWETAGKS